MKTAIRSLLCGALALAALAARSAAQGVPHDCLLFSTGWSAFRAVYFGSQPWVTIVDQGHAYEPNNVFMPQGAIGNGDVDELGDVFSVRVELLIPATVAELCRFRLDRSSYLFPYQPPWRVSVGSLPLTPHPGSTQAMALRDAVWVNLWNGSTARYDGILAQFDKTATGQPFVPINLQIASGSSFIIAGTDGREAFGRILDTSSTTSWEWDIIAVDLRDGSYTKRPILHVSTPTNTGFGLVVGRDGRLLLMNLVSQVLQEIHATTGAITATYPLNPPGGPGSEGVFAYDPWSDLVFLGDRTNYHETKIYWRVLHAPGTTWTLGYQSPWVYVNWAPYDGSTKVTVANEKPFESFGIGCLNGLGKEPRLSWQGLPRQGNTFSIKLRDGEPNGFALMWIGWSDTFWAGVGALPFDAAPFGAPGCRLLVSPDGPLSFFLDGNGAATWPIQVPSIAAIAGMQAFAQSVSSSTANTLGFASSDAVVIRFR